MKRLKKATHEMVRICLGLQRISVRSVTVFYHVQYINKKGIGIISLKSYMRKDCGMLLLNIIL